MDWISYKMRCCYWQSFNTRTLLSYKGFACIRGKHCLFMNTSRTGAWITFYSVISLLIYHFRSIIITLSSFVNVKKDCSADLLCKYKNSPFSVCTDIFIIVESLYYKQLLEIFNFMPSLYNINKNKLSNAQLQVSVGY